MAFGLLGGLLRGGAREWDREVYWALDLETGGLNARRDPILAVGMVPVRGGTVRLGEAYRTLVRPADGSQIDPASIRAHQLVWGELREAPPLAEVLPEIDRRLREGALLVHFQAVDVAFLRRGYRRHGLPWPRPPIVDTAALLHRISVRERRRRPELPEDHRAMNLTRARLERGLPDHPAHDALSDALATAELFLVLRETLGAKTLAALT
jgi:DNA polymerase-3 subunit epsilon